MLTRVSFVVGLPESKIGRSLFWGQPENIMVKLLNMVGPHESSIKMGDDDTHSIS